MGLRKTRLRRWRWWYAGDADGGSVPWPGRAPGEGNGEGRILWYSCLENPMDCQAMVHRVMKSQTRQGN